MSNDCKKNTKPCGCGDQPLQTPPPCNQSGDCAGENCAEKFCQECIVYCQPDTEIRHPETDEVIFTVSQGESIASIFQRLMSYLADNDCAALAPYDLKLVQKTSSSIKVSWIDPANVPTLINWTDGVTPGQDLTTGMTSYTIINLLPDTEYKIEIVADDGGSNGCASVTLTIKTNAE